MASSSVPSTEVEMERKSTIQPNWLELPRDITQNILQRLSTVEIITSACQVCPLWWNICKDPRIWRTIHMSTFNYPRKYSDADLVKICCNAVVRSCGQLEEIDIQYFGTDDHLLGFIVDRASHLRCIRLTGCYKGLSDKGFSKAMKKLPQLEELGISNIYYLSKDSFEVVGRCCPLLKSLTWENRFNEGNINRHEHVLAIAKTMPGLRHLKFSGNVLTKEGLHAILNGCPLLESLNLQDCYGLYLSESLRKMCYKQIKDFIPPVEACSYNHVFDWDNLREALRGDSSDEDDYFYDDDYYYDDDYSYYVDDYYYDF